MNLETGHRIETWKLNYWRNSPEAISVLSFNASTVSISQLAFVDALFKLYSWILWSETWNSVGKQWNLNTAVSWIHSN